MIKKFLLASSVLSLACAANAEESEVYVIKDGKMVNAEFVPSSEDPEVAYEIEESTNAAGDAMVKVKNPAELYKTGLLYLPKAIDLDETWNMEIEYYFDEGTELSDGCAKHEGWAFDLMADTLPVKGATWSTDPKQAAYRIAHVSIDARMRDFYGHEGNLDNHGVGSLRTVTKYVYSSALLPKEVAERGDANKVKAIFLSMFSEAGSEIVGYIKNLKFVSDGTKPFYADKMTTLGGEGTIYMTAFSNYVYGSIVDDKFTTLTYADAMEFPTKMYGQQLFYSNNRHGFYNMIKGDRMYCDLGEQGEADFYDTEYGFLPYLTRYDQAKKLRMAKNDVVPADAMIRIPLGDAVENVVSIAMRLGHNAGTSGDKTPYANYKANSKDIRFPVEYRFEKGDAKTIESPTEWAQFVPNYTKGGKDAVDSIPTMMSMVYGDVEVPGDGYKYITLRFIPNDVISYMFGDIRLTGDKGVWPRSGGFTLCTDYTDGLTAEDVWPSYEDTDDSFELPAYEIPCDFVCSDVKNVVAKGAITIFPNPASDVITVTNEGVKSVAIYSVAGTLVASSESNVVSVANLANGTYVVKANTEAGVITGQIIKK
ncbi:MAG: T9SS type A sorting domain-containing protein [Paludibacteraceae bacterium]|nr:T9SS type A sorting domain-containing protein [Paludibacteraceae bacterium]